MLGLICLCLTRCGKRRWGIGLGDPMVAPRRVIALPIDAEQRQRLLEISRSRTEPTGRVERARLILAYLADPSAYAVARSVGVTQQTATRCLERAAELGVIEALDDRPRAGRDPVITAEATTWLVALACRKAKGLGYPHELWTTRLLPTHARQHGPSAGIRAWQSWPRERFARSWPSTRSSRTFFFSSRRRHTRLQGEFRRVLFR